MKIEGKHISATEGLPVVESRDVEKEEEGFIGTLKHVVGLNLDKEKMQSREKKKEKTEEKGGRKAKKKQRGIESGRRGST